MLHTTELRDVKLIYEASSETLETIMELMQLVADGIINSSLVLDRLLTCCRCVFQDYDGNQVLDLFTSRVMEEKWDVVCRVSEIDRSERAPVEGSLHLVKVPFNLRFCIGEKLKAHMLSLFFIRSWTQNVVAIARARFMNSRDGVTSPGKRAQLQSRRLALMTTY